MPTTHPKKSVPTRIAGESVEGRPGVRRVHDGMAGFVEIPAGECTAAPQPVHKRTRRPTRRPAL